MNQLQSEHVVVSAPMSFHGSAARSLIRRGSRKRKIQELQHREMLATMQQAQASPQGQLTE